MKNDVKEEARLARQRALERELARRRQRTTANHIIPKAEPTILQTGKQLESPRLLDSDHVDNFESHRLVTGTSNENTSKVIVPEQSLDITPLKPTGLIIGSDVPVSPREELDEEVQGFEPTPKDDAGASEDRQTLTEDEQRFHSFLGVCRPIEKPSSVDDTVNNKPADGKELTEPGTYAILIRGGVNQATKIIRDRLMKHPDIKVILMSGGTLGTYLNVELRRPLDFGECLVGIFGPCDVQQQGRIFSVTIPTK